MSLIVQVLLERKLMKFENSKTLLSQNTKAISNRSFNYYFLYIKPPNFSKLINLRPKIKFNDQNHTT